MDTTAIDAATQPGTFDVLSFVEATAYPTETVVVFQNVAAADHYVKLINKRVELEAIPEDKRDTAAIDALAPEIEAAGKDIEKSSIIFDLQGMPPGVVQDLLKGMAEDDPDSDNELIAKTIKSVRNAAGAVDPRTWTAVDVKRLRDNLKEGEFGKLVAGVGQVNFNAMVFDQATDAGFSGRRADVA